MLHVTLTDQSHKDHPTISFTADSFVTDGDNHSFRGITPLGDPRTDHPVLSIAQVSSIIHERSRLTVSPDWGVKITS